VFYHVAEKEAEGIFAPSPVKTVAKRLDRDQQVGTGLFFVDCETPALEQHGQGRREKVQRAAQPLHLVPKELQLPGLMIIGHCHGMILAVSAEEQRCHRIRHRCHRP